MGWSHPFKPAILQTSNVLSLEKIYLLGWMNAKKKDSITLGELTKLPFLKNLRETESFKNIKNFVYAQPGQDKNLRSITLDRLLVAVDLELLGLCQELPELLLCIE